MTVRALITDEVQPAAELAARAFHDDPLFAHLHPDPATRDRAFAIEHAAYVRRIYLPSGQADALTLDRQLAGVALWLPPDALAGHDWLCLPALVRANGLVRAGSILREYAAFNRAFPTGRRFQTLGLLAVEPGLQGRGVGSALLRHGLARADADGLGAYLETGTLENVAFYERFGFRVIGTIEPRTAPMHWAMWRQPAGSAS